MFYSMMCIFHYTHTSAQCDIGAVMLALSAWIRYAGTKTSLPINGAYALLIVGQVLLSVSCAKILLT
jgi:hypothetical protein